VYAVDGRKVLYKAYVAKVTILYVANFLPLIPYTVVLPVDGQVGRNML